MSLHLPNEIWREIFRESTFVPFLLDTEWKYSPEDELWSGWGCLNPYQDLGFRTETLKSGMTKRSIVSVCRVWRGVGIEFLYESIQIPYEKRLVTRLLEIMKRSVSESYLGHGWWTKRIGWVDTRRSFKSMEAAISLMDFFHNLEIVTLLNQRIAYADQTRLADVCRSRFSHSLRRFEGSVYNPDPSNPAKCMDTLPNVPLTSLSISITTSIYNSPLHPVFDAITTLVIYLPVIVNYRPAEWHFPNLKSLSFWNFTEFDMQVIMVPFVQRHSHTLTYLHLKPTYPEINSIPLLSHLKNIARTLSLGYDHLQHLWRLVQGNSGGFTVLHLPSITHLGIVGSVSFAHIKGVIDRLLEYGMFPNIVHLRLLQDSNGTEMTELRQELIQSVILRRRGIRLVT